MTDTMTPEQRHRCMAAIKGKDTKPEMIVRRYLHALGFRYGLHNRKLPGSPDLIFRSFKTVVFIHGCFWHGHAGCKYYRLPKSNVEFWQQKIERNRQRDKETRAKLIEKGWNVITVWECDLRDKTCRELTLSSLANKLNDLKRKSSGYEEFEPLPIAAEPDPKYGEWEISNY